MPYLVLVCTPVPYLPLLFQRSFGLRSSYEIDILDTDQRPEQTQEQIDDITFLPPCVRKEKKSIVTHVAHTSSSERLLPTLTQREITRCAT
jgi:hypothetical protein